MPARDKQADGRKARYSASGSQTARYTRSGAKADGPEQFARFNDLDRERIAVGKEEIDAKRTTE